MSYVILRIDIIYQKLRIDIAYLEVKYLLLIYFLKENINEKFNFFDEFVSNKNKLFESSINESTDANEKKMIKSKLNILTKESLGLEFKKI